MSKLNYKVPHELLYEISTKKDGNLSCLWGESGDVEGNRKRFVSRLNLSIDDFIHMHLDHGSKVMVVDQSHLGMGMRCGQEDLVCDALITKTPGVNLFVLTADCLPITLYDLENKVLGLAHVSRINAQNHFIQDVVGSMELQGAKVEDIRVYIGPCIYKESYLMDYFDEYQKVLWGDFAKEVNGGKTILDLIGYNQKQLMDSGVVEENIFLSGVNTCISPDYYSHYRAKATNEVEGRFATVVGIKK